MRKNRNLVATVALALTLSIAGTQQACTPPSWVTEAEQIAEFTLPIIGTVASIAGAGPLATQVTNDITLALHALEAYQRGETTLDSTENLLATVSAELAQFEQAAHVVDPASQQKIAAVLQLIIQSFNQIQQLAASADPNANVRVRVRAKTIHLDHKVFLSDYDKIVKGDKRFPKLKDKGLLAKLI